MSVIRCGELSEHWWMEPYALGDPCLCGEQVAEQYTVQFVQPEPQLWAVHIGGSDDLVACPDREAADRLKEALDDVDAFQMGRLGIDYSMIVLLAPRVVPWPYSPEAHAAQLMSRDSARSEVHE